MEYLSTIREHVIARLMTRHGLSEEEASQAWRQYQLRLLALRLRLSRTPPLDRN